MSKTLLALLTTGNIVLNPIPQVVETRLIGFTLYPIGVIALAWDTDGDEKEDLRVFYKFQLGREGAYTYKPYIYFQDLNGNLNYEENEEFIIPYKEKTEVEE